MTGGARITSPFAPISHEVSVPFESATFDISRIDADRAAINESLFSDVDAILLPTLTAPAPSVDEAKARGDLAVAPDNTFFCNYYGLPATNIPAGLDSTGLPFGVQLVGPRGADELTRARALVSAGYRMALCAAARRGHSTRLTRALGLSDVSPSPTTICHRSSPSCLVLRF